MSVYRPGKVSAGLTWTSGLVKVQVRRLCTGQVRCQLD